MVSSPRRILPLPKRAIGSSSTSTSTSESSVLPGCEVPDSDFFTKSRRVDQQPTRNDDGYTTPVEVPPTLSPALSLALPHLVVGQDNIGDLIKNLSQSQADINRKKRWRKVERVTFLKPFVQESEFRKIITTVLPDPDAPRKKKTKTTRPRKLGPLEEFLYHFITDMTLQGVKDSEMNQVLSRKRPALFAHFECVTKLHLRDVAFKDNQDLRELLVSFPVLEEVAFSYESDFPFRHPGLGFDTRPIHSKIHTISFDCSSSRMKLLGFRVFMVSLGKTLETVKFLNICPATDFDGISGILKTGHEPKYYRPKFDLSYKILFTLDDAIQNSLEQFPKLAHKMVDVFRATDNYRIWRLDFVGGWWDILYQLFGQEDVTFKSLERLYLPTFIHGNDKERNIVKLDRELEDVSRFPGLETLRFAGRMAASTPATSAASREDIVRRVVGDGFPGILDNGVMIKIGWTR